MFDSVLDRGSVPKSRFGTGTVISIILHVGLFALALWLSTRPPPVEEKEIEVTFKAAMAPPPPHLLLRLLRPPSRSPRR